MANYRNNNEASRPSQGAVFRRRIDEAQLSPQLADNRYAASAISYPERVGDRQTLAHHYQRSEPSSHTERKGDGPLRWQQNYSTQDLYLSYCVREALIVDILMKNDSTRQGRIESYDNWSLLVSYEGKKSLLFKSGVMAITASDRKESRPKEYLSAQHLSDFSSEYSHNPA